MIKTRKAALQLEEHNAMHMFMCEEIHKISSCTWSKYIGFSLRFYISPGADTLFANLN